MLHDDQWDAAALATWNTTKQEPFQHAIIDNFLTSDVFRAVVEEFPSYGDPAWLAYASPLEQKKALNVWDKFGTVTYRLFAFLNAPMFVRQLERLAECTLYPDAGLSGAGLHCHARGGKLNVHLDYDTHPKLPLQRKLNLIIYVSPTWEDAWGGALELWSHDDVRHQPQSCRTKISVRPNRAVIFDTTQNSWHGLPEPLSCPPHVTRNSLAVYYLSDPQKTTTRRKALFAPYKEQVNNAAIQTLIVERAQGKRYSMV